MAVKEATQTKFETKWESELWSYISSGDGEHCPFYNDCGIRLKGKWCPDDNRERLNRLLDGDHCPFYNNHGIRLKGEWCPDDNRERLNQLLDFEQFEPGSYDSIRCGGCGGIFKMVEMLAQKYLKMGNIHSPPVPAALIALCDKRRAVEVREVPLKVYWGAIWRLRDKWVIHINADASSCRKRFTMFHEAFHILAHCKTTPVFRKRGTLKGAFNELLAEHFALYISMPREWVKEKWAEGYYLTRIAEIFDVPESVACLRLRLLGLI